MVQGLGLRVEGLGYLCTTGDVGVKPIHMHPITHGGSKRQPRNLGLEVQGIVLG